MWGYFVEPLPDETLYSICARQMQRSGHQYLGQFMEDLGGIREGYGAFMGIPIMLNRIVERLPRGSRLSVEDLLRLHTLFPVFEPFLPLEAGTYLKKLITEGGDARRIKSFSYSIARQLGAPRYMRYCPACIEADRERFDWAYWHRLHQCPGVLMCPNHHCWLVDSPVHFRLSNKGFVAAEALDAPIGPLITERSHLLESQLVDLAVNIQHVIEGALQSMRLENVRQRYDELLSERGLIPYSGKVRPEDLHVEVGKYYSDEMLELIGIQDRGGSSVARLLYLTSNSRLTARNGPDPLSNMVLIKALSGGVSEFSKHASKPRKTPTDPGPWPCLNRLCSQYNNVVITAFAYKGKHAVYGQRLGIFECPHCGYAYMRRHPAKDGRTAAGVLYKTGWLLDELIVREWANELIPLPVMARRLRLGLAVLIRRAGELGLAARKQEPIGRPVTTNTESTLERHRRTWLAAREENPKASITQLRSLIASTYYWLLRFDSEWYRANRPSPLVGKVRTREPRRSQVDWSQRDRDFAASVEPAARDLYAMSGKPQRVTQAAIAKRLLLPSLLFPLKDKLPLTITALARCVECVADFQLRSVNWALEHFSKEKTSPTFRQFRLFAGIDSDVNNPRVRSAVEAAVQKLARDR